MTDTDQEDSWYKRCSECKEWRVTDMRHCWKCGTVLGPAYSLEEVMKSKKPVIVDTMRTNSIKRLWQTAKVIGYEHKESEFMQFFEELNRSK